MLSRYRRVGTVLLRQYITYVYFLFLFSTDISTEYFFYTRPVNTKIDNILTLLSYFDEKKFEICFCDIKIKQLFWFTDYNNMI